jgi:hypothetical protein
MAGDAGLGAPKESRSPAGSWDPRPARTRSGPGAHRLTAYGPSRSRRPPAPKPGIIPLRPIGVGEILTGAFTAVRRNPGATLGITAVITFCYGVGTFLLAPHSMASSAGFGVVFSADTTQPAGSQFRLTEHGGPAAVAMALSFGGIYLLLSGMLTAVIGRLVLGVRMTAGQAMRAALPLLPAMVGTILLPGLVLVGLWGGYVLAGAGLRVLTSRDPMAVFFFVVAGIALFAVTVWLVVSYSVALQALVLERTGPLTALRRSRRLASGSWWRVFGIGSLTAIIVGVVSAIIRTPFQVLADALTKNLVHPPVTAVIISTAGRVLADTITTTVAVGVLALLYVDLRIRQEGLDRTLQIAAQDTSADDDEFAAMWAVSGTR